MTNVTTAMKVLGNLSFTIVLNQNDRMDLFCAVVDSIEVEAADGLHFEGECGEKYEIVFDDGSSLCWDNTTGEWTVG